MEGKKNSMKKKVVLGKKLFLKKETISELTIQETEHLLGGMVPIDATNGTRSCVDCNPTGTGCAGPGTGVLCGASHWVSIAGCNSLYYC